MRAPRGKARVALELASRSVVLRVLADVDGVERRAALMARQRDGAGERASAELDPGDCIARSAASKARRASPRPRGRAPRAVRTACLQSMKKSLSLPEASTTRLRSKARVTKELEQPPRARSPLPISAPSSSRSGPWPSSARARRAAADGAAPAWPARCFRRHERRPPACARAWTVPPGARPRLRGGRGSRPCRGRRRGPRGRLGARGPRGSAVAFARVDETAHERAGRDDDAGRPDVADDARAVLEQDGLFAAKVALHGAAHDEPSSLHAGADHPVGSRSSRRPPTAISPSTKPCTSRSTSPVTRPRMRVVLPMIETFAAMAQTSMSTLPLNWAPSAIVTRAAFTLPMTRAPDCRSTRSVAVTLPVSEPATTSDPPATSASTVAPCSIVTPSLAEQLAAHGAGHDDVFVRRDLAFHRDARADDRARHGCLRLQISVVQRRARAPRSAKRRRAPAADRTRSPAGPRSGPRPRSRPRCRAGCPAHARRRPAAPGPVAATSPSSVPAMVTDCASTASLVTVAPSAIVSSPRMARSPSTCPRRRGPPRRGFGRGCARRCRFARRSLILRERGGACLRHDRRAKLVHAPRRVTTQVPGRRATLYARPPCDAQRGGISGTCSSSCPSSARCGCRSTTPSSRASGGCRISTGTSFSGSASARPSPPSSTSRHARRSDERSPRSPSSAFSSRW